MKTLIVTADDFGLTEQVNEGIIKAHRDGIVTTTSLMANGGAFEDAVSRARQAPQLAIGAHLNLTQGTPISPKAVVRSLVNADGQMRVGPIALGRKVATGQVRLSEVEVELRAQIERIIASGVRLTHLDGHKHIQLLPGIFEIVLKLALEFGIKGIRCAVEPGGALVLVKEVRRTGKTGAKQFGLARAFSLLALKARPKVKRAGLFTPRYFLGIMQTGFLDIAELSRILNNLPNGPTELMTHPGYADAALARTPTRLLKQREEELRALINPGLKESIAHNGIHLISYRELSEAL
jgi:hopanoid biosynthesis associated protein HpnK